MVALTGFEADRLKEYGAMCKQKQVRCEDAEHAAKAAGVEIVIGGRGIIGATASLPFFADPSHSVIL